MDPRELQGHTYAFMHWCVEQATDDFHSNVVQYANERMNEHLYSFSQNIVDTLNPNKTYLNIGTGVGFLEYCAREANIMMTTMEQYPNDTPISRSYEWWLNKLNINVDYRMTSFDDWQNFKIKGPAERFDEILATRFGPFQRPKPRSIVESLKILKEYAPALRIWDWECKEETLKVFKDNYEVQYLNSQPAGKRALRIIL